MLDERIRNLVLNNEHIDDEIIGFLDSSHKKYVYGSGLQASVCLGIFRDMKVKIDGLVMPLGANKERLSGFWGENLLRAKECSLNEILEDRDNCDIILCIDRNTYSEAIEFLNGLGIRNVYTCCWERNIYMKEICYKLYERDGF